MSESFLLFAKECIKKCLDTVKAHANGGNGEY